MVYNYLTLVLFAICCSLFLFVFRFLFGKIKIHNVRLLNEKQVNEDFKLETEELIGNPAFNFVLQSTKGIYYEMKDLSKDGIVLIFSETGCPVCNPLLEEFLDAVEDYPRINYAIIQRETKEKTVSEVSQLFNGEFFLKGDEEVFSKYKIIYRPTYVYINENQIIEHVSLSHDILLDKLLKPVKSA